MKCGTVCGTNTGHSQKMEELHINDDKYIMYDHAHRRSTQNSNRDDVTVLVGREFLSFFCFFFKDIRPLRMNTFQPGGQS